MANIGETQTSSRPHGEVAASFTGRRGHTSQLSISDPSHHVTEAIGTLYGEDDDSGSDGSRPLSFVTGLPYQEQIQPQQSQHNQSPQHNTSRNSPVRTTFDQLQPSRNAHSDNGGFRKTQGLHLSTAGAWGNSQEKHPKSPSSPTPSLREVQADPSFPLTNIDNPNDIAQELSNLQALRRLSMDVGNSIDPDMPPMSLTSIPAIAPRGDDDENDPSRLLWVPARVHPELAPTEFKSFLENRLQSIRRRSGDSFLTVGDDTSRSELGVPNASSLRRKKSMLSRQIDNSGGRGAVGYIDGAERLERKRSHGSQHKTELSLDDLVRDPTRVVQKLAQESQGFSGGPESSVDDMPILPIAPGAGLRRSTRTTYQTAGSSTIDPPQGQSLARVQTEPTAENYSRPTRSVRRQQKFSQDSSAISGVVDEHEQSLSEPQSMSAQFYQDQIPVRLSSVQHSASSSEATGPEEIRETLDKQHSKSSHQRMASQTIGQRSDSRTESIDEDLPIRPGAHSKSNYSPEGQPSHQRHTSRSSNSTHSQSSSTPMAMSSLPGGSASHTDTLTFIPTLIQDEKKTDKKGRKDRDDETSTNPAKSGGAWKWFKGGADDKEKRKDESKKSRSRASSERAQDNARLDLIQTSIDKTVPKGRESLVLDRDHVDSRLQEERKKESNRRGDSKKDKDGSIFSSIFGGSKKKEEKEKSKRSQHFLQVPEDPPYKPLKPDVDYNWTRFPLLEERAIYRMAHIKLANPRRSLHSQVLLSNFMYSYLAIVQAMHPQMNVPISPQQKRLEEEARRKQQEQQYLAQQDAVEEQDAQQSFDQYNFDYHRMAVQYANSGTDGQVDYVDEAQIYEDEQENHQYGEDSLDGYGQDMKDYLQYRNNTADPHHDDQSDAW
ncbi:Protein zds1 [Cladobotryum mycophilum]|uniref:Protein zds1 n=1 Tax=Cladobotryum mycophilum TaxID=491253 RepID=A0ABR0S6E7_9HYPO